MRLSAVLFGLILVIFLILQLFYRGFGTALSLFIPILFFGIGLFVSGSLNPFWMPPSDEDERYETILRLASPLGLCLTGITLYLTRFLAAIDSLTVGPLLFIAWFGVILFISRYILKKRLEK